MSQNNVSVSADPTNFSIKIGNETRLLDSGNELNLLLLIQMIDEFKTLRSKISVGQPITIDSLQKFCMATFCIDANKDGAPWNILNNFKSSLFPLLNFVKISNTHSGELNTIINTPVLQNKPSLYAFMEFLTDKLLGNEIFSSIFPRHSSDQRNGRIPGIQNYEKELSDDQVNFANFHLSSPMYLSYDAGYDPSEYYLYPGTIIRVNSFAKAFDSSSFPAKRDNDILFPNNDFKITIDSSAFQLLGYPDGSSIDCHSCSNTNYASHPFNYEIKIGTVTGQQIVKRKYCTDIDLIKYNETNKTGLTVGNKKRTGLLYNPEITDSHKKALIISKSWGDRLQVFFMFLFKQLNLNIGNLPVCITTCDKVVLLFCILFKINCFYFHTSRQETDEGEDDSEDTVDDFQRISYITKYVPLGELGSSKDLQNYLFDQLIAVNNEKLIKTYFFVISTYTKYLSFIKDNKEIFEIDIDGKIHYIPEIFSEFLINYINNVIEFLKNNLELIKKKFELIMKEQKKEYKIDDNKEGIKIIVDQYIQDKIYYLKSSKCTEIFKITKRKGFTTIYDIRLEETREILHYYDPYILDKQIKLLPEVISTFPKFEMDPELESLYLTGVPKNESLSVFNSYARKLVNDKLEDEKKSILNKKNLERDARSENRKIPKTSSGGNSSHSKCKHNDKWFKLIEKYLKKQKNSFDEQQICDLLEKINKEEVNFRYKKEEDEEGKIINVKNLDEKGEELPYEPKDFDANYNLFNETLYIYFKQIKLLNLKLDEDIFFFVDFPNFYLELEYCFDVENGRNYPSPLLWGTMLKIRLMKSFENVDIYNSVKLVNYESFLVRGIREMEKFTETNKQYKELPKFLRADEYFDTLKQEISQLKSHVASLLKKNLLRNKKSKITVLHKDFNPFSYFYKKPSPLIHDNPLNPVYAGSRRRMNQTRRKKRPRLRTTRRQLRHNPHTRKRLKKPYRG